MTMRMGYTAGGGRGEMIMTGGTTMTRRGTDSKEER